MITNDDNVDGSASVKEMEKDEGNLKKVECLRGRLIAERAASKLAKHEAHQMECKVGELETQLKSEIKSRKRADKKLKFLINKLNSLNIPYFSEDFEKKSELSPVTSSVSSALTKVEEKDGKGPIETREYGENEGNEKKGKCQKGYKEPEAYVSQISTSNQSYVEPSEFEPCQNCNNANVDDQSLSDQKDYANEDNSELLQEESQSKPNEEDISYVKKDNCEESNENDPKIDDQSSRDAVEEKKHMTTKEKSNEAQDDNVDESLAMVLVDLPKEPPQVNIDPLILDANVKQVLDALNHAKQRLLLSMERRHMIVIGTK